MADVMSGCSDRPRPVVQVWDSQFRAVPLPCLLSGDKQGAYRRTATPKTVAPEVPRE